MKRILLADDHPAIRNGVKQLIENRLNDVEFGEAANAIEVFKLVKEQKWDLIIMDMDMPGRSGLDVIVQLREEKDKIPVLMFSMHVEGLLAIRALKAGAAGYLTKDTTGEEMMRAIELALAGKKYITPFIAEKLAQQLENPLTATPHDSLSDREYETLILFGKGKTVSEIAKELCLGVPTVSTYRARILEKMNMKNNAEIISYAIKNNLV